MKRRLRMAALLGVLLAAAWFGWRQYEQAWLNRPIAAVAAVPRALVAPIDDTLADTAAFCTAYDVSPAASANC